MKQSINTTLHENNRQRAKRKRMALFGAMLLTCLQPICSYAGPAEDRGTIESEQKKGPASDDSHSSSMNAGGPGSGTSSVGSSVTGSSTSLKLPLRPATGYGSAAVLGGLKPFSSAEAEAEGAIARGIDVSYWNQNIDWDRVAADQVQFAMLATRFRGQEDPFFSANADAASKAGIRLGAYIYSYATSVQMAEAEADFVLEVIKDYPISFPVVFDAEDAATLGTLSPSEVSRIADAFCRKIQAAGYYPMVYANDYWLKNKMDLSVLNYDVWVARYQERFTYADPTMWQASNTGSVDGISGNVDINYLYKDYSQIIPGNLWRNISGNWYYYKDHAMQRQSWIHDGTNWYYMNQEGNPATGWIQLNGVWYYLDPLNGALIQNAELERDGVKYWADADGRCTPISESSQEGV